MSEPIKTSAGDKVDKALNDLLVTTETLGYQRGKLDTIQRIIRVLDDSSEAFKEAGDLQAAKTLQVAIKVIGSIYVN